MTHPAFEDGRPLNLLGRVRRAMRLKRLSPRTEEAYVGWIKRYVIFHRRRHPSELNERDLTTFLSDLAVERKVSAATQAQALAAILFLYARVLGKPFGRVPEAVRARKPKRLPNVLSVGEVRAVLAEMRGAARLVALLMYGGGLRLSEALCLRIHDLDFERGLVTVRSGKGDRDRVSVLPKSAVPVMRAHLLEVHQRHRMDCAAGGGFVELPGAMGRKVPSAPRAWEWQWVFPASRQYLDQASGELRRHHLHDTVVQRAISEAGIRAGIPRRVKCHTLRHSFATHLLDNSYDIRTIQELMGHRDIRTTMIYTHVLNRGGRTVNSPLDSL